MSQGQGLLTKVWSGSGFGMSQYKGCPLAGKSPLNSSVLHCSATLLIMPADHSSYNQHNFSSTRGCPLVPYPSAEEAFRWSNMHSPSDNFSSLGLSNFFITNQCVACHQLDWLTLPSNTQELLAQGVQVDLKCREPYNPMRASAMLVLLLLPL